MDLYTQEKISALVDEGVAEDEEEARAMLVDMGEIDVVPSYDDLVRLGVFE